uniref:Uncharacterized protein n=1 Tax=Anguilla anguilla TaxID=7936 RepID=A0A0E9TMJ5_ANGAN
MPARFATVIIFNPDCGVSCALHLLPKTANSFFVCLLVTFK